MNPSETNTASALSQVDALIAAGRHQDAIDFLRPRARVSDVLAVKLGELLRRAGRAGEAVGMLATRASRTDASLDILTAYGAALQDDRRLEEAVTVYQRARQIAPASGVAEHNLAAALGDGHWFAEAEAATSRAMAKSLNAPETWMVRARALQGLGRFDEADRAFREVIARRPTDAEAHAERAQLIWMLTEDASLACRELDAARAKAPVDAGLARAKARFLDAIGDLEGAYAVYADILMRPGADPMLNVDAALVACWFDANRSVIHAERAVAIDPWRAESMAALCQAYLAAGHPAEALPALEAMRRIWPQDQFAIGLMGMAWRMMGDPRYRDLYDYARLVKVQSLDVPAGWSSLTAFVADLRTRLNELHLTRGHPIGQSLRNGTQTAQSLDRLDDPVIKAFFVAIDGPIRAYLQGLTRNGEALGRRYTPRDGYRFDKAWSIRLRAGGFHVNHLHPKGWISSACHVGLPAAVGVGHEGWLSFGQPGLPTSPPLAAEHFVKPQEGGLTLFPSYMWHGTEPFSGDEPRLSAAFDVIPG